MYHTQYDTYCTTYIIIVHSLYILLLTHVLHVMLIDNLRSVMFWTDFGDTPEIKGARMDGTSPTSIIGRGTEPFSNLRYPNDIAIDFNTNLLYFCEGGSGIIGVTTLTGNNGRILVDKLEDNPHLRRSQPTTRYVQQPRSLSLRHLAPAHRDDDFDTEETELFWADPDIRTITSTDLVTTGGAISSILKTPLRPVLTKTGYNPLAVQFVSSSGHKPGGGQITEYL